MFGWLKSFIGREIIADVPADLDACQDCGKLACTEGEFESCSRRRQRADEVVRGSPDDLITPPGIYA